MNEPVYTDRYASFAGEIRGTLGDVLAGFVVVVAPPGEQALVAAALARAWEAAAPEVLGGEPPSFAEVSGSRTWVIRLPAGGAADAALIALNGARERLIASRGRLILVVSRAEVVRLQRLAGDLYAVATRVVECPFVPDEAVTSEEARAGLAAWQREHFGRLDLRGFVRAPSEDVSWSVEDVYQDLHVSGESFQLILALMARAANATTTMTPFLNDDLRGVRTLPLFDALSALFDAPPASDSAGRAVVLLGHPGSGKTFFLRWLALRAAGDDRLFDRDTPLPVLLPLAAYARSPGPLDLRTYIVERWLDDRLSAVHLLDRAIDAGRVLFLLDGLDEVGDEAMRRRVVAAVRALIDSAPRCRFVITSRISGYSEAPLPAVQLTVAPLDDESITRFLVRWCERYAADLHGAGAAARGRQEGERLARDVTANRQVLELARTPLLLTVLAIVHRAGIRLPDHRVEVYSHATRVLVERWNQVRSLSDVRTPVPIKVTDAVRLLGPVALDMVRRGTRVAIPEDALRASLERTLAAGNLRGFASADEVIELFQRSLGLLVEQAPGLYAFVHLTLVEYFAAWELVRSRALESLVADVRNAFYPEWREVLLLALAELGVVRADDARLDDAVRALIESSRRRTGKPSPGVPSLLAGILADDPQLPMALAEALVDTLIPTWWFRRQYGVTSILDVVPEAAALVSERLSRGRFADVLRGRLDTHFGGDAVDDESMRSLRRSRYLSWAAFLAHLLRASHVDDGALLLATRGEDPVLFGANTVVIVRHDDESLRGTIEMSQRTIEAFEASGTTHVEFLAYPAERLPPRVVFQWAQRSPTASSLYFHVPFVVEGLPDSEAGASPTTQGYIVFFDLWYRPIRIDPTAPRRKRPQPPQPLK